MPIVVMLDNDTWTTVNQARVVTIPQQDLDDGKIEKHSESGLTVQELIDFVDKTKEITDSMLRTSKKCLNL